MSIAQNFQQIIMRLSRFKLKKFRKIIPRLIWKTRQSLKQKLLEKNWVFKREKELALEWDSFHHQVAHLTQSLLDHSTIFDEKLYQSLNNGVFGDHYVERTPLSATYCTTGESEYYSCIFLQQMIDLSLDGLALCCHPHSGNRGCVRIGKFHGDIFPIDLLLTARLKVTQDMNAGIDTPCTGCDMLQKKAWKRVAYPIRYFTINDWTECNLRCEYCYTLDPGTSRFVGEKRTHRLPALLENMFENQYIAPDAEITWGGGEVTIYKDFEHVCQMFLTRGMKQSVNTNAVLFSEFIEQGLREKTMQIQVSVDAGTREIYKKIKGRDAFDVVWDNIAKYARTGGDLTVKYILYNTNSEIDGIKHFIQLCQQHHVNSILVTPERVQSDTHILSDATLRSAAIFIHDAKQAGLHIHTNLFYPQDQLKIEEYVRSLG